MPMKPCIYWAILRNKPLSRETDNDIQKEKVKNENEKNDCESRHR